MPKQVERGLTTLADLVEQVQNCVARVTRYPLEVLTPDASFDDELGIDSVKLAEIIAVLARELAIPVEAIPRKGNVKTIKDIAIVVADMKAAATSPAVDPLPAPTPSIPAVTSSGQLAPTQVTGLRAGDLDERIRAVLARVTRYPLDVLTADADFENELGIDSVKFAEIAVALGKEFDLNGSARRFARIRTIRALAEALGSELGSAPPAKSPAAPPAAPPVAVARQPSNPVPVPLAVASPSPAQRVHPSGSADSNRPLQGKVVLVTGSGRGLGRTIAEHLTDQGATVVVNSFHSRDKGEETARALTARGGTAVHLWGSVAQPSHLDGIFGEIEQRFGGLDLLVCNASDGLIGPFDQISPTDWDRAFRTNITGTYECAMRAARSMGARGGGSIVTLSTVTAHRYLQGFGCQGVVKAAVESLTRYLACELAPKGVRVNCVSAGPVYGELISKFPGSTELIKHWESITPGGTLCTAEDVAAAVGFLLSPVAVRMTGAIWCVDNGVSGQIDGRVQPPSARQTNGNGASTNGAASRFHTA